MELKESLQWDAEQEKFIATLKEMDSLFEEIFEKDKSMLVINRDEHDTLKNLQQRNAKILNKLRNKEFTVSVVGLEKAGKSTLANALLKLTILPEYTERCTYTTTEIRAGEADSVEIAFYSNREFDEKFKSMLREVKFDAPVGNWDTLSLATFERYWQAKENDEPSLFQTHNGTTVEDIKKILEEKSTIKKYLDQKPQRYEGKSEIDKGDFKIFITGMVKGRTGGAVKRSAEPYAVKDVVIHSAKLNEKMRHMVLYDVPGFDSPTDIHKKQTEAMLKRSDAIILVTNVGDRPNLTGPQLNVLRNCQDEDNVMLNEKAFVFGNKLDRAQGANYARDNMSALEDEAVNKYRLTKHGRIICGSAKGYLETQGLLTDDDKERGASNVNSILEEWGLANGVSELENALQDYYLHDRFAVLRRRANNTIVDARGFLEGILERNKSGVLGGSNVGAEYILEVKNLLEIFVAEANKIGKASQKEILQKRPFSTLIEEKIAEIFPLIDANSPIVIQEEELCALDSDAGYPFTKVDAGVREKLAVFFLKNLVAHISSTTREKESEIEQLLITTFLDAVGSQPGSIYRAELEESVRELFEQQLVQDGEHCHFNSLVERFTTVLMETLVKTPFASDERLNKLINPPTKYEFITLAVYYLSEGESIADIDSQIQLFSRMLTHESSQEESGTAMAIAGLKSFFEENRDDLNMGVEIALDLLPFGGWAKTVAKAGIKVTEKLPQVMEKMLRQQILKADWEKMSAEQKINALSGTVEKFARENAVVSNQDFEGRLREIQATAKSISKQTREEMIALINEDISLLKDIMLKAVIKAIGLERAFNSIISKNINIIRTNAARKARPVALVKAGEQPRYKPGPFDVWIDKNVKKIKENEFARIDEDLANDGTRKMIVSSIEKVLDKMNV